MNSFSAQFYQGCKEGDLSKVRKAVEQKADISIIFNLCFLEACSHGYVNIIDYLINLDKNIDLNQGLEKACVCQKYEAVTYLMNHGADIKRNNYNAFKLLVDNCSFANAQYQRLAKDILKVLIQDVESNNPLMLELTNWSLNEKHDDIFKQIIEGNLINLSKRQALILFKQAIEAKNTRILNVLLKEQVVEKHLKNLHINETFELFNEILESKSLLNFNILKDLFNDLTPVCQITQAINEKSWEIAYELLKTCQFDESIEFNYELYTGIEDTSSFFIKDSKLEPYYEKLSLKNNKEIFTYLVLSNSFYDYHMETVISIIKDRKILEFKEEYLLQFLMESGYIDNSSLWREIFDALISENYDLKMDTQGYLIQHAIKHEINVFEHLSAMGSNIEGFWNRYRNKKNWLNKNQYKNLTNIKAIKRYDIYKKFDEENSFDNDLISQVKTYLLKSKIEKNLDLKEENKKTKI